MLEPNGALESLRGVSLPALCDDERFRRLDQLDAYYSGRQYSHLRHNWDGAVDAYGAEADIAPGWFVPLRMRKPRVRIELAKLIVRRFTAMLLGEDRFPAISVDGDDDAEDFVNALVEASNLRIKLQEARDKGGTCGTAVMSFGFVQGRPQVQVHRAKHIKVLRWADRYELRPAEALKAYRYERTTIVQGRPKAVGVYFARVWTETHEVLWEPIPEELARSGQWFDAVPSHEVRHDYGECPVYIAQNLPDSDSEDGESDFAGLLDDIDEINRLYSATSKGTIANVDPTLVIKMDPAMNTGSIRKGSENAIFSPAGAEYLELRGDSIKTAMSLANDLMRLCLDVASVVLGDPDKMAGSAKSAAAMRILYQPMINQCDKLRAQYGDGLLVPLLQGMLRAARKIHGAPGEVILLPDGRRVQDRPVLTLPPRLEEVGDGDERRQVEMPRTPGRGDTIKLRWGQYFKPTLGDVKQGTEAAIAATGKTISDRTAVQFTASMFGVTDVEAELQAIAEEREERMGMLPGPETGALADLNPTLEAPSRRGTDEEGEGDDE